MWKFKLLNMATIVATFYVGSLLAQDTITRDAFEPGIDYQVMSPVSIGDSQVEEFFNYACGACFAMEKLVKDLKQEHPDLKIKPVPVELHASWRIYVKAYYIGERLGVLDRSHDLIFHRIHVEKKHFKNEQDMKDFFLALNVSEKDYDDVANSFWLSTQMRLAKSHAMKYEVAGTPIFLINQRYKLDNKKLGSYERIKQAVEVFASEDVAVSAASK